MANLCNNAIRIAYIRSKVALKTADKMLDEFKKLFSYNCFEIIYQSDDNDMFEISMDTAWSSPDEFELQKFATKHKLTIIGVSWEFSNGYVNSFNIVP